MNNEIKEILDEMKFMQEKKVKFYSLDICQSKLLLDYITNLQQQLQITQEKWNKDKQWVENRTKEWLDYKLRIQKAVKKLEEYDRQYIVVHDVWSDSIILKVIDILNGRSDE